MMNHGTLVPKDCVEDKKLAPKQDYVNREFRRFFEERDRKECEAKVLVGFKIEDEVIEDFLIQPN